MKQAFSRRDLLWGRWLRTRRGEGIASSGVQTVEVAGPARILIFDCIAHQGGQCFTCRERCPVPGAIVTHGGRPRIVPEVCTSCGICQQLCPAQRNAILIPRMMREIDA